MGLLVAKLSNKEGTKAVKVGNRKSKYYAESGCWAEGTGYRVGFSENLFCPLQNERK